MLLDLRQTVVAVEESPADEVEATTKLTTELLRTLYIGNLLEELVSRIEISQFQVCQTCTLTNLVDPVDSLLCGAIDLILALCSTKQHIRVAHHTQVDTTVKTSNHLVVDTCAQVRVLSNRQSTIVVIRNYRNIGIGPLVGLLNVIDLIAILKAFPLGLIGTDSPIETGVE